MAYGLINADTMNDSSGGIMSPISSVIRNRIINGQMTIDQRNAGASVTIPAATTTYSVDRWAGFGSAASKFSMQQNAGSVTPPAGFKNYLGCTSLSAYTVGASETFIALQSIEGYNIADLGWGTANAKSVTLSFQVYSSLTGTFGGYVANSGQSRSYPFSYSIPVANTWTTISVTIAGDTSGTWLATNGIGIQVGFSLGTGSSLSGTAGAWAGSAYYSATGATSVVGTNGATFYVTGVQFEKGTSATGFEYRQYQQELALCQRYYYTDSTATYTGAVIDVGTYAAYRAIQVPWKQTMRTAPTFTYTQSGTITSITPAITITSSSANMIFNGVTNNFVQITTPVASAEL